MNKIFIDCGAHVGDSIETFMENWKDWSEYKIYSFEPNPKNFVILKEYSRFENITVQDAAVWIHDGKVNFYIGESDGSSVVKEKVTGKLSNKPTPVKSIDLSKWISKNFTKDDFIILKLDIEGGEYELIPHLIKNKTFEYIDELYIEFHTGKVNRRKYDNEKLLEELSNFHTKVHVTNTKTWKFI